MKHTYRNKTDQELWLPGVGVVAPHGTVEVEKPFHNANFERVDGTKASSEPKKKESDADKPKESTSNKNV